MTYLKSLIQNKIPKTPKKTPRTNKIKEIPKKKKKKKLNDPKTQNPMLYTIHSYLRSHLSDREWQLPTLMGNMNAILASELNSRTSHSTSCCRPLSFNSISRLC